MIHMLYNISMLFLYLLIVKCALLQAPFELRALEVVLDFITLFLEFLVTELEKAVHPVLDAIVSKVRGNTSAIHQTAV